MRGLPVVEGLVAVGNAGPDGGAQAGRQQELPGGSGPRTPALARSNTNLLNILINLELAPYRAHHFLLYCNTSNPILFFFGGGELLYEPVRRSVSPSQCQNKPQCHSLF